MKVSGCLFVLEDDLLEFITNFLFLLVKLLFWSSSTYSFHQPIWTAVYRSLHIIQYLWRSLMWFIISSTYPTIFIWTACTFVPNHVRMFDKLQSLYIKKKKKRTWSSPLLATKIAALSQHTHIYTFYIHSCPVFGIESWWDLRGLIRSNVFKSRF